ncbi:MAG: O-antigen ligase family protein [Armatimonadota bacterium]
MLSAAMLLAALILAPVIGGGFGELEYAIIEILVFGAVIAYFLAPKFRQTNPALVPGLIPLAAFFVLVLISTVFSEAIYPSLKQLLLISACLGAYVLVAWLANDSKVAAAMVTGVVLSALGVCAAGIRHYAISTGGGSQFWAALMSTGEHMRLFGSFINPGYFAGFIVLALPLTLGVYLVARRPVLAVLIGLAFIVETIALMLTGAKFGIVSAAVGLLIFFMLAIATKSLRRSKFIRLLMLAVVLIPLLVVFSGPVRSRIVAAETGGSQVHSTTFRVFTWEATVNMIKANPWVGVGPGVYSIAYPRYTIAGPTKAAHQSYLQLASESGVAALVAFVLALLAIAHQSIAGILKRQSEHMERGPRSHELHNSEHHNPSWSDFVPFSGWRLVNCAIYGSLAGSVVRNLVDSDWYIIGIALPFWVLAGVLVSQSGAVRTMAIPTRWVRTGAVIACAIFALLSISFGLGSYFASHADYEIASKISPLNSEYHREWAKYLAADGDMTASKAQLAYAARLAPTEGSTYHVGGMIALANDDPKAAVGYFKKALKCSPNATSTIYEMSIAYGMLGDEKSQEQAMSRLIEIENSSYEQLKGAPELVDTTFARAHAYFGEKYLAEKKYTMAANEYVQAIERLERWKSNKLALQVALCSGLLTEQGKRDLLALLRESYFDLAKAYDAVGNKYGAREAREKGG